MKSYQTGIDRRGNRHFRQRRNKLNIRKITAYILISAMMLQSVCFFGVQNPESEVEAATNLQDFLDDKWDERMTSLGWATKDEDGNYKVASGMWYDTSTLKTVWLRPIEDTSAGDAGGEGTEGTTDGSGASDGTATSEYSIDPANMETESIEQPDTATATDANDSTQTEGAEVANDENSGADAADADAGIETYAEGDVDLSTVVCFGNRIDDINQFEYVTGDSVSMYAFSGQTSEVVDNKSTVYIDEALDYQDLEKGVSTAWEKIIKENVSAVNFTWRATPNNTDDSQLYYTVECDTKDEGFYSEGYYRHYYISTADQLALLLYGYKHNQKAIKAQSGEGKDYPAGTVYGQKNKLVIELLCDIDLGGSKDSRWWGYSNSGTTLEIIGNGHTIYNGYLDDSKITRIERKTNDDGKVTYNKIKTNHGTFFTAIHKFTIHDVTFSNMYIPHNQGMFGGGTCYAYFNNVNFEKCLAVSGVQSTTIILGSGNSSVYLKDCTISDSYVRGYAHNALFASYNGATSSFSGTSSDSWPYPNWKTGKNIETYQCTYLGDTGDKGSYTKEYRYYYTDIPDDYADVENIWNGANVDIDGKLVDTGGYKLTADRYPTIYENCATINSEVYDPSGNHSGTFVSCNQGNIIFKDCFSNCTMYGNSQAGVFIGCVIGSADGFYYPVDREDGNGKKKTLVNTYFENCYASGVIEAANQLGGFVGSIFTDTRSVVAYNGDDISAYRGSAVFKNCYSTSSVGMDFSGNYVGGFAGLVYGNVAAEKCLPADKQFISTGHIFINCYAAGEVGGIATQTDNLIDGKANNNTIGGFFGSLKTGTVNGYYYKVNNEKNLYVYDDTSFPKMYNCYYDKQTTAMRERDIGDKDISGGTDSTPNPLAGTLTDTGESGEETGLIGVYTTTSANKGVSGLADTEGIMNSEGTWIYNTDTHYYPQLSSLTQKPDSSKYNLEDPVQKMRYDRQMIYYYYSLASTATVILDHYDQILNENGTLIPASKETYDTVRDITSKFYFTTDDANINKADGWKIDAEYNKSHDFTDYMGTPVTTGTDTGTDSGVDTDTGTDSTQGFSVVYDGKGNYILVSSNETNYKDYTRTFVPKVLNISRVYDSGYNGGSSEVWKCLDFAPGKQWVSVHTGSGDYMGHRYLRLLPTAYLNAGNIITVNVAETTSGSTTDGSTSDETSTLKNEIIVDCDPDDDGRRDTILLEKFNHSVGVVYGISDIYRMGTDDVYEGQKITEYIAAGTDNTGSTSDKESFAFYKRFPIDNGTTTDTTDGNTTGFNVGLNSDSRMYAQTFENSVTSGGVTYSNNSTAGMTMVKVYKTETKEVSSGDNAITTLERGDEITAADELKKWNGETPFEVSDEGFYYMVYYWRLNDGRYLEDVKLVRITSENYSVEVIAGILGEEHTVNNDKTTDIDIYVTPNKVSENEEKPFIMKGFASDNGEAAALYDRYNVSEEYNDDSYYVKSKTIITGSDKTEVGWSRTPDYKLTSLIIQVHDGTKWVEMERKDVSGNAFDYTNAKYSYESESFTVTQNPDTKLFTLQKNDTVDAEFSVEDVTSHNSTSIQNSILFDFSTNSGVGEGSSTNYSTFQNNLRVIVLFRSVEADVTAEKTVLMGNPEPEFAVSDGGETGDATTAATGASSFMDEQAKYVIDNTGITDDTERKAVLSGDEITYRVKLHNTGYMGASTTGVEDVVPEGCTYVDGSMRIYRQKSEFGSNSVKYYQIENVTPTVAASAEGDADSSENSGEGSNADGSNSNASDGTTMLTQSGYIMTYNSTNQTLSWTLPGVEMNYDYYVEYKVKVDDISAANMTEVLTNTATYDFISLSGNTSTGEDTTSVEDYQKLALFNMDVKVQDSGTTEYTITFEQISDKTFQDISFKNEFPTGFEYDNDVGIKLYKYVESSRSYSLIGTYKSGSETVFTGKATEDDEKISLTLDSTNASFTLNGFSLSEGDKYQVVFTGKQTGLGDTMSDGTTLTEIRNRAQIVYTETITSDNNTTEQTHMANAVSKTERLTNRVETDVTWMYFNIEKEISANDPEQSFLFKVEYYPATGSSEGGTADGSSGSTAGTAGGSSGSTAGTSEVFYTRVNCTTPVYSDGTTGSDGADTSGKEVTGYTGSQIVQCGRRGTYIITEVDDWSATDYDFSSVSTGDMSLHDSSNNRIYPIGVNKKGNISYNSSNRSVTMEMPRLAYSSGAIPTSTGTDLTAMPTARFENTESIYAYLSGQALMKNIFK